MRVIPYSYTPAAAAIAGLEAIVARAFGGSAAMTVAPPVAYGAEDPRTDGDKTARSDDARCALQRERDARARSARRVPCALARRATGAEAVLALVDEGAWVARWKAGARADRRSARGVAAARRGSPGAHRVRRSVSRRISRQPSRRSTPRSRGIRASRNVSPIPRSRCR